eukprot:6174683-Pleurochrysis_carterae.AAC.4
MSRCMLQATFRVAGAAQHWQRGSIATRRLQASISKVLQLPCKQRTGVENGAQYGTWHVFHSAALVCGRKYAGFVHSADTCAALASMPRTNTSLKSLTLGGTHSCHSRKPAGFSILSGDDFRRAALRRFCVLDTPPLGTLRSPSSCSHSGHLSLDPVKARAIETGAVLYLKDLSVLLLVILTCA